MTDVDRSFEVRLVPPTPWSAGAPLAAAPRLPSLEGVTVVLVANGKANGMALLEEVAQVLAARHGVRVGHRHTKPHPSLPVDDEVLVMAAEHAHAVLTAIGD
jgi:hypothetical protein